MSLGEKVDWDEAFAYAASELETHPAENTVVDLSVVSLEARAALTKRSF